MNDDWEEPSRAVVASDGDGHGCVLWTVGPHVAAVMEETSSGHLDALDLSDAPKGLSVWTGAIRVQRTHTDNMIEYDSVLHGAYRPLTDDEWQAVRENRCPWSEQ